MDMVIASLNEAETLAMKAARGAGLAWGEAEDIGRAARWLAERDLDWAGALKQLLGSEAARVRLAAAFHLADRAAGAQAGASWTVAECDLVWALPLLALATRGRPSGLTLRAPALAIRLLAGGAISMDRPAPDLAALPPRSLTVTVGASPEALPIGLAPKTRRSRVSAALWHDLEALAALTYVPASAQSRAGAGASGGEDD